MRSRIIALVLALALIGGRCGRAQTQPTPAPTDLKPATITIWRVFDAPEAMNLAIERYRQLRPQINVVVEPKQFGTFELEVADAIAAGTPPDIWMIRNDWLPRHISKLQPMPNGLLSGLDQGASNTEILAKTYPEVVAKEAIAGSDVYGIPLAIDSLALYYNKDHLAAAGLAPPATWTDFIATAEKLTQFEDVGRTKISRAGAAIGTAANINRSSDILMLLMLQNGAAMTSDDHLSATFNGATGKESGGITFPGTAALEFYTGFADPKKSAFTWNNSLSNSIDAFAEGKVSMIFGYQFLNRILLQKNPTLNFGVAPMPQIENTPTAVDYPTYWLEVVSRNSQNSDAAWDFLKFMAEEGDTLYQQATGKPPAKIADLKTVAVTDRASQTDPGAPWNFQALTADSWFRGTNPGKVEQIFNEMIENVTTFGQQPQVAIDNASAQVTSLLQEGS